MIKITIQHQNDDPVEFNLESLPCTIGRGSQCDIKLDSDYISRKHLEVSKKDNEFYIKDLTLSNWVSYNGERLPKETEVQYFDFAPLLLPGEISVKIENNLDKFDRAKVLSEARQKVKEMSGDDTGTKTTRRTVKRGGKGKKKTVKKVESNSKRSLLVIVFLALAVVAVYVVFIDPSLLELL